MKPLVERASFYREVIGEKRRCSTMNGNLIGMSDQTDERSEQLQYRKREKGRKRNRFTLKKPG